MSPSVSKTSIDSFEVFTLANRYQSLSIVPELGGRIVSIRDMAGKREWLDGWEPENERRLWKPSDPDNYETSPGAGIDECLPTVLPCHAGNHLLPDHGELWSAPAPLAIDSLASGALCNSWKLSTLPLAFERRITLEDRTFQFRYRLKNLAAKPSPFQWAWHPLFSFEPGDEIRFVPAVDSCQSPGGTRFPWPSAQPGQDLSRGDVGDSAPPCAKVFVGPFEEQASAEIHSPRSVLRLNWSASQFPWAGVWITRGAWKNLHHWAIEPTNLPADRLSDAQPGDPLTTLEPRETREWQIVLELPGT